MRGEKIGLAIITCNRLEFLKKCFDFHHHRVDHIVIVNDGDPIDWEYFRSSFRSLYVGRFPETTLDIIEHPHNMGVAKTKNDGMRKLMEYNCDHIFVMEDDIYIKDNNVFDEYIRASKISGIQHFNFSQHGLMNVSPLEKNPIPRLVVDYGEVKIPLYPHCVGAFSYYSKYCLLAAGLMDENYYNACEHVDHTYTIILCDLHPPFWYFADIEYSQYFLGDEEWSPEQSVIHQKSNRNKIIENSNKVFHDKFDLFPTQLKFSSEEEVITSLKNIKLTYAE